MLQLNDFRRTAIRYEQELERSRANEDTDETEEDEESMKDEEEEEKKSRGQQIREVWFRPGESAGASLNSPICSNKSKSPTTSSRFSKHLTAIFSAENSQVNI